MNGLLISLRYKKCTFQLLIIEIYSIITLLWLSLQFLGEYYDIVGEPWPLVNHTLDEVSRCLANIDCVYCVGPPNGNAKWYVQSDNTKHIKQLILEQKAPVKRTLPKQSNDRRNILGELNGKNIKRKGPSSDYRNSDDQRVPSDDCFFVDNVAYRCVIG